jgi:hypothetical protein
MLVAIIGGSWLLWQNRELRTSLTQLQMAQEDWQHREQRLQAEATEQRARGEQLAERLAQEQSQRAQLEQAATLKSSQSTEIPFVLTAGTLRSTPETKRLIIPPEIRLVQLQLDFEKESAYQSYRVSLQNREGDEFWSQGKLRARATVSGQAVILSLPATVLAPGDYILKLSGAGAAGQIEEISSYAFRVVKR